MFCTKPLLTLHQLKGYNVMECHISKQWILRSLACDQAKIRRIMNEILLETCTNYWNWIFCRATLILWLCFFFQVYISMNIYIMHKVSRCILTFVKNTKWFPRLLQNSIKQTDIALRGRFRHYDDCGTQIQTNFIFPTNQSGKWYLMSTI